MLILILFQNTLVFRAETSKHSQAYLLKNSGRLGVGGFQEAEHSIDQEQGRVSELAVVDVCV
jgi:hypothetical protein